MVVIDTYSRKEAVEDGQLIEVESSLLKEVGIKFPSAVTCGLVEKLEDMPAHEDYEGRVYDMLYMFTRAVKGIIPSIKEPYGAGQVMYYEFILNDSEYKDPQKLMKIKSVIGPGDYPEDHPHDEMPPAVLTFMLPEED